MSAMASQITSHTIVYSTVYSDHDQIKHQSSASLAFGMDKSPVNSPHKWPVTRKMSPFDDVIMFLWIHGIYSPIFVSVVSLELGQTLVCTSSGEPTLGLYSLGGQTSYCKILWRLKGLDFSNRSKICQVPRQQRCGDACQSSQRCDHYNIQLRSFETSRDLAARHLTV